jgi:hypothetical protein
LEIARGGSALEERRLVSNNWPPLFFILRTNKVLCFDTLLEALIPKIVEVGRAYAFRGADFKMG